MPKTKTGEIMTRIAIIGIDEAIKERVIPLLDNKKYVLYFWRENVDQTLSIRLIVCI